MFAKYSIDSEIERLVDYLCRTRLSSGWSFTTNFIFALEELLSCFKDPKLIRPILTKSLSGLAAKGSWTLEEFKNQVLYEINKRKKEQKHLTYTFFLPLDISFPSLKRAPTFSFQNIKFSFIKLTTLKVKLKYLFPKTINVWRQFGDNALIKAPSCFLVFKTTGANPYDAYDAISPTLSGFRGLIELSLNLGNWRISSHEKPRANIPFPKWCIALSPLNILESISFSVPEVKPSHLSFQYPAYKNARYLSKVFTNKANNNSILYLLSICLRLYSQAMDEQFHNSCFIGFWQIAEALTFSQDFGGRTDIVATRLEKFLSYTKLPEPKGKVLLQYFCKLRNDIVHQGLNNVDENHVNTFKVIIETAFMWILNHRNVIKTTKSLKIWYETISKPHDYSSEILKLSRLINSGKLSK